MYEYLTMTEASHRNSVEHSCLLGYFLFVLLFLHQSDARTAMIKEYRLVTTHSLPILPIFVFSCYCVPAFLFISMTGCEREKQTNNTQ